MKNLLNILFICLVVLSLAGFSPPARGCTIVVAGKDATVDGSVITSHTDACDNSRLVYVPAMRHKMGSMAPVYWGLQDPAIAAVITTRLISSNFFMVTSLGCPG